MSAFNILSGHPVTCDAEEALGLVRQARDRPAPAEAPTKLVDDFKLCKVLILQVQTR